MNKIQNFFDYLYRKIDFYLFIFLHFQQKIQFNDKIFSATYTFEAYDWSLGAAVVKSSSTNKFNLVVYLRCESFEQKKFPLYAKMMCSILNHEKDLRKNFLKRMYKYDNLI